MGVQNVLGGAQTVRNAWYSVRGIPRLDDSVAGFSENVY